MENMFMTMKQEAVSIQLVSPARGEPPLGATAEAVDVSFPFNWFPLREGNSLFSKFMARPLWVSIQLVSPARGELFGFGLQYCESFLCFHSIGFPCERGTS